MSLFNAIVRGFGWTVGSEIAHEVATEARRSAEAAERRRQEEEARRRWESSLVGKVSLRLEEHRQRRAARRAERAEARSAARLERDIDLELVELKRHIAER